MTRSVTDSEAVWRNLMRLADRLSSTGVTDCDLPSRLPLSQLRVVGVIYDRHPAGVMLKDIADELKLTPGAISQTVDVLVRENLVERTTSPTDRRAILLRPTAAGLELKEQHARQINAVMQTISKDVKSEDFDIFTRVLAHLLEQINTLQPPNK
ncbi:MAG: winged helix-turn-helix transcriptional regulator [Lentisphaeria bacterium]|nr:winged helix-turn-helix transcriptional regulator [Lentisphaeria bacterium]